MSFQFAPLSPLSQGSGALSMEQEHPRQDDDSLLSTLSPQSSFETNDAHARVKSSWSSAGESTIDDHGGAENELGHEVFYVNPTHDESDEAMMCATTPKAGAKRLVTPAQKDDAPKTPCMTVNGYDKTPKAGTTRKKAAAAKDCLDDDHNHLSTPSWDIEKTFSFRKKHKKKQDRKKHHQPEQSQSSFSGIWNLLNESIGLSRSESMTVDKEEGCSVPAQGDYNRDDDGPPMPESQENDLFAMEVGLMFSVDEGDTINDPSTLYQQTFSGSFTIESEASAPCSPAYDLQKYLKHRQQQQHFNFEKATTTKGCDESTIYTAGQSTVRDDHGNKVPENAKMILGYEHAKLRKGSNKHHDQAKLAFPTVQKTDAPPEEMERRLRELAGQISSDWRGPDFMPPALARRLRDFQFAREKRRKKYGKAKPWGILGLYDHLSGVKLDVEWAEDAAWRRKNGQPYLTWSDYEAMKNEGFARPVFTFMIVSACTAMMFTSIYVNDWRFEPLSVNPMIGPSAETLVTLGAKDSYLIVVHQEIWRLASPLVLHAGLVHFFINMFALCYVGKAIEQIHGFFPAIIQFVVPAIGGTILSAIFLPEYITVGASGGIFGLIGACISDIIMNWNLLFNEFVSERGTRLGHARVLVVLFVDIVLNCLVGMTPFVDNFTHLGGMIYGFMCGLSTIQLVSPKFFGDERHCFHKFKLLFFRSVGLLVCMAGIIASSTVLFSGDGETTPCDSCKHLSCMTFPPWNENNDKWWYCDDCSKATAEGTLDKSTGKFIELSIQCPSGSTETVGVDDSWPQEEVGLEQMLPMLCREHCLW